MFTNSVTGNFVLLFCLVDSGASNIILNAQFAPLLGIDLTAATAQEYQGVGEEPFRAYKHQVTIRLQAAAEAFTVPCAFMPDLRIDCILGQNGFFDTHKIVFEKYKKRFAITPIIRQKK
jgi:Aspartyl protease